LKFLGGASPASTSHSGTGVASHRDLPVCYQSALS
jgi:hypothetical protein